MLSRNVAEKGSGSDRLDIETDIIISAKIDLPQNFILIISWINFTLDT